MDYLLTCLAVGSTALVSVPSGALEQARHAAAASVELNVVLRRYTAGHLAIRRILASEVVGLHPRLASNAHNIADEAIDAILRCAANEYEAEVLRLSRRSDPMLSMVLGLLNNEVHTSEIDGYILDRWHIAFVTDSAVSRANLSQLLSDIDAQALVVEGQNGQRWVWLGKRQPMSSRSVAQSLERLAVNHAPFGLGEWRRGINGWRLTHTEARTAADLPGAERRTVTRMRRHLLEAAVLDSREFTEILVATYIEPLEAGSKKLATDLRLTLEAYLSLGQNAKSAAESLGIDRHTVVRRLRKVEELVDERIEDCSAQFEIALRVATVLRDQ